MFSLEKKRLQRDLVVAFQYLDGAFEKKGRYFIQADGNRTRGNSFRLKEERFRLLGKNSLPRG